MGGARRGSRPVSAATRLRALAAAMLVLCAGCGATSARARTDRWKALAPSTIERTEVAAARIGRSVYVVGGYVPSRGATTALVERYDIARDRWTRVRAMPIALNHAAAASWRGNLYVLGGYRADGRESDALLRYDPARDRWARLARAPSRRAALTVGVIGDRLYAAGGARATRPLATLEVYDARRDRWSRGPSMRFPREHLAGAVSGGAFYVLAGRASGLGNFTVAERYRPATRRWQRLPDLAKARGGIAAATLADEVELYAPRTRRWSRLPDLRTPRHGLGVVAAGNRVYAIEGGVRPGLYYSDAIEALDVP